MADLPDAPAVPACFVSCAKWIPTSTEESDVTQATGPSSATTAAHQECLAAEAARWAATVHVECEKHDHEDLMDAYWRSKGPEVPADPEPPEPEDQVRPGSWFEEAGPSHQFGYGVGEGWEEYASASFWWRGHNLLQAEVLSRTASVSSVVFCCRCGTVSSDGKLTPGLESWCKSTQVKAGGSDQLRRIKT